MTLTRLLATDRETARDSAPSRTMELDLFLREREGNPGEWVTGRAMPTPRTELAVAEQDGKIYVAGGYGGLTAFEAYDVATDTVDELENLRRENEELRRQVPVHRIKPKAPDGARQGVERTAHVVSAARTPSSSCSRRGAACDAWRIELRGRRE